MPTLTSSERNQLLDYLVARLKRSMRLAAACELAANIVACFPYTPARG